MGDRHPPTRRELADLAQIGARLSELRQAAGLTQRELAEKLGVHRLRITKIETGQTVNLTALVLMRLARALDVEPCALLEPPGTAHRGR